MSIIRTKKELKAAVKRGDSDLVKDDAAGNVIETHEHKGDFKEW
jgi:hypothetical protein